MAVNPYTHKLLVLHSFDKRSFVSVLIATATSLVGLDLRHVGLPGTVLAGLVLSLLLFLLGQSWAETGAVTAIHGEQEFFNDCSNSLPIEKHVRILRTLHVQSSFLYLILSAVIIQRFSWLARRIHREVSSIPARSLADLLVA